MIWIIGYLITVGFLVYQADGYTVVERHEAIVVCFLFLLWPVVWFYVIKHAMED